MNPEAVFSIRAIRRRYFFADGIDPPPPSPGTPLGFPWDGAHVKIHLREGDFNPPWHENEWRSAT